MPEIPIKYLKYIDNTGNVQKAYGITVLKAVYDADGNTLDEILQTYDNKVGDTSSLTTTANTDLVSAINEVDGNVGDLSGLSTTAKNNLVAAVNELNNNLSKKTQTLATGVILEYNKYVATLRIKIQKSSFSAGWNNIATVPEGLAPSGTMYFCLADDSVTSNSNSQVIFGRLNSVGEVSIYAFADKLDMSPSGSMAYMAP